MAHVPPARHLLRARDLGIDSGFRDPSGNSLRLTQVQLPAAV